MKFRTTAIAMAVAGTVAAPVAVQAGADEIYASARVGLWNVEGPDRKTTTTVTKKARVNKNGVPKAEETTTTTSTDGTISDLEVKSFSSRFGARGETDLGNGLTGFGRYEWDVDENDFSIRHRYVGLKGDFGSVLAGQTFHTFYNFAVGPNDNPWWHSGYAMVSYRSRTDHGITYAGGSDAFSFGATTYFDRDEEENAPDQYEVGASFAFDFGTLGAAMIGTTADQGEAGDIDGDDEAIYAVALSGMMFGDFGLGLGAQVRDDDTSFLVDASINNFYAHVEAQMLDEDSTSSAYSNEDGDDQDRISYTLGYTQSLGRKTTMYYELNYIDNDTGESDDDRTAVMAVLKYDII